MDESTHIFDRYLDGSESAADELFHRYLDRLTRLARSRLSASLAQRVDAEDVVMSAYRSFFIGTRDGEFSIQRGGDLWALLARITLNKLFRTASRHTAQKRDVRNQVELQHDVAANEPSVVEALAVADQLKTFMGTLENRPRRMLELRLQGSTIQEIAEEVGVHERTVRRHLDRMCESLSVLAGVAGSVRSVSRDEPDGAELSLPAQRPRPPLPIGNQHYADFALEKQIGLGGMGRVYRARCKTDGQLVAIKYLRKSFLKQPAAVERFVREATTVGELAHPNIVPVRGFGRTDGGGFFIVLELVEGEDLERYCREHRPTPRDLLDWLSPIADALTHAHGAGVVHCDLKPGNILISAGKPMLTDFGLARRVGERVNATEFSGTVPFMAPEQIDPGLGSIGPQTDVYGLGAVLFHLLTGRAPFAADRVVDVMAQIVTSSKPPRPSDHGATDRFDGLCHDAMTSVGDRIASASDFAARLRALA